MTSLHQTIVVELGSSRIKVGFAGESKPRRILDDGGGFDGASWTVGVNDGMISTACEWSAFFNYLSAPSSAGGTADTAAVAATTYEWEKSLYPLFSHILTSILFIQRPSRHRMLVLVNDAFPPRCFREALHKVLLDYLGVGGVWFANGGVFESLPYLLDGLTTPTPSPTGVGRPRVHLLVDIGTYEARVKVCVEGCSSLGDTHQSTMSGYRSFLRQVMANYQELNDKEDASEQSAEEAQSETAVSTLEDANAIVQTWLSSPKSVSPDSTTISVNLPSQQIQPSDVTELPIYPLLQAFHQVYLDYANPSSLIYSMLTSIMTCPIDYRKGALQNVLLLGGGSVALRHFGSFEGLSATGNSESGLGLQLELAARKSCGAIATETTETTKEGKEEEKKEDGISSISRHRFLSLSGAVFGNGNDRGIHIRYPDPFAADMAAWMGGSIVGTLGYKNYQKKM
mmetsp:Transcript_26804/g.56594  ORF Transcript_26804/g.56594 Transcript_26804/m.56594 type:complete len:455 (+) Transcript_26804:105-1469(+)|eukprot:CAMPEP_0183747188 /NCGR_PEP_ID=MMETSP0737-20130205/67139_1 /TAXON_ID=385413 /ORGANISM="Thalassiosira miniscula, Strain CCMP1093" /LENGTH=454 /DNA_ID=CAMNT_0025982897 /DNA_START=38 /DNA_END=1402 /DNA_ORIENTATION=+